MNGTGTVNEIGKTQKGSPKIKIDGVWYFAGKCPVEGIATGQKVEFTYGTFGDKNDLRGLESWKPVGNGTSLGKPNNGVSDDAEMRFISNCVGQAIAAGTIKEPGDITIWFQAAKRALKLQPDFDDEPNF